MGRSIFEEIAGRAGLDRADDVAIMVVGREDEDGRGVAAAQRGGDTHAIDTIAQAQIAEDDVWVKGLREGEGLGAGLGLTDDVEVRCRAEEQSKSRTHDRMVVDKKNPDRIVWPCPALGFVHSAPPVLDRPRGSEAEIAVPSPGSDSTMTSPPRSRRRARMAARP